MDRLEDGVYRALLHRGISRRSFIKFSAAMAATLALPAAYGARIAAAVETAPRIPLIWLRGQSCGGESQALLQSWDPTVGEILIDLLSVDYSDAIMAPSGAGAERSLTSAMAALPAGYIAVVEGSIPSSGDGTTCVVGGRAFGDVVREVCAGAVATIAVGSCAFDGGLASARGSTVSSAGVGGFAPSDRLVNLPGCPVNGDNLAATLVHYLTFKQLPPADLRGRPLFAYGGLIHNQCERRAHFEFGEFVLAWGDEAAQKGWCLYKMGCKGPETFANCPTIGYAGGTSWAVQAGHGCIGCTMPGFWDAMGPAYARLPAPIPFIPDVTADQIGEVVVAGVAGLAIAHGAASWVRGRRNEAGRQRAIAAATAGGESTAVAATTAMATPSVAEVEPARVDEAPADRVGAGPTSAGDIEPTPTPPGGTEPTRVDGPTNDEPTPPVDPS
jgi:hydrogenase small subunit